MLTFARHQGLRGIASVFVVASHLTLCYARSIIPPCCGPDNTTSRLFQRPILRLVASGHSWVAVFFILMGFVNSLKPLSLARSGQNDQALAKLASSFFGRICRLVIPATVATVISCLICNLGLYQVSQDSDAYWLKVHTPFMSATWTQALKDLLAALQATWLFGYHNPYDQPQWALVYLLQGSIMIIGVLFLTINMTPYWRSVTLGSLVLWSMNWSHAIGDPWTGVCCFIGIILGEFSLTSVPQSLADISPLLTPVLSLIALVFMSFPGSYAHAAPWSRRLEIFGTRYLGVDLGGSVDRFYGSLGGILLAFAILISPHTRWALSRPPLLWLGKVSFAIYLLHGIMMRTIFAWVLHLGHPLQLFDDLILDGAQYEEERYPVPGPLQCAVATVIFAVCTGATSHVWTIKLEPVFAQITTKLERLVTGKCSFEMRTAGKTTLLPLRND